ncbi:Retrovirus-related Pol polyprotein from type-1 retrotransposable element R1 [Eumeta japonica]|uniref:Retrovirus-related Pol polyprotein from type-1 retrotransposable element R1 n=1 Tax=Eumeta variegata TaxID=151549 RepID=A0A4C1U3Y0_EUMVA|nr:Retrovirus-related Pol polyprotein from type-1 retrotransposable element R1 [Eumeta japonica]
MEAADKTHEWENARVENKMRNRNARTAGRTGSKLRPTTRPLATNARSGQNDSDDSSESPEIQSSDCRVTQLATEKGISIALVQEPCRKPRHPKTKSRHQKRKGLQKSGNRKSDHSWRHKCGATGGKPERRQGQAYRDFLDEMGFHILNTGSTPTFETQGDRICSSIVDVTACSSPLIGRVENWRVTERQQHRTTTRSCSTLRQGPIKPMLETEQLQQTLQKYGIAEKVERTKRPEDLEANSREYIAAIQEVYVLRKEENPQRSPHEKKAVIEDYLTAKTIYTQKAEIAQTESWKEYCTTQDKESMWDKVYRVIRNKKGRLPDTLLRNSEGKTLSPHESAKLLANTFYPDDSVSTDMPFHIRTRERIEDKPVEGLRLSEDDPPFTLVELKAVLRELNPKKAPGPDGLTADICIAAIESEMEVFLAIANKCLELAYFPTHWKTAHVVIIPKPGKEDYTLPKSYRPIGLLPIPGKIVEN